MSLVNFVEKYLRLTWKKEVNVITSIIIEYDWICLNKQDSASVTQRSEYARIALQHVLNISWVLYQDSEYGRVLNMKELHRVLSMP